MFRTIFWILFAVVALIVTLPLLIVASIIEKHDPSKQVNPVTAFALRNILSLAVKIAGIKIEVTGMENIPDEAVLFVGNHQGYADIILAATSFGSIPSFIVKDVLAKVPLVSGWLKSFDCLFINRENPREGLKTINKAAEMIEAGRSIVVFPEGTRSWGPEMGEFKDGAFKAAIKAGAKVVPFAVDGSYKIYEAQKRIKPGTVKFAVLPPIETEGKRSAEISKESKAAIQEQLDIMRKA